MATLLLWGWGLLLVLGGCSAQQDEIRQPPIITSPSSAVERFVNGKNPSNVTVLCQATGKPMPTYEWYKDNVRLPGSNININVDETTGVMVVWPPTQTGLQPEDIARLMEGNYICQAKTTFPGGSYAVAISDTVRITVVRVSQWTPAETDSKSATEGSYISIPCRNVPETFGEVKFEWSWKANAGAVIGDQIVPDARRFIDQTGTLHFIHAEPADRLYFLCGIKNAFQSEKSPITTQLSVTEGTASNVKPVLQGSSRLSNKLTYEVGKTGYLECVFSGYDSATASKIPTIKWYNGAGQEIFNSTKYTVSYYGRFLEIRNLEDSDEQQYRCDARNSLGTADDSMTLNVTSKPMWDPQALRDMEVPEGRDANLYCQTRSAVGEAPPNPPRWSKNGVDMSGAFDPTKYIFTTDKKMMTVKTPLKDRDIACFQCYVSNSVGTTFSSGCLNVVKPIVIVAQPKAVQSILTAMEGDGIIDLTVVATADPFTPPIYEWAYKNKTYANNDLPPFVRYDPSTKYAYINVTALTKQQREAIAGVYYRRVYNRAMEIIINVTVQYGEPSVPAVAEASYLWIIGVIIAIIILLLVIIILICVCCRRKMQEGDYHVDKKEKGAGHNPEKELKDSGFKDLSRLPVDNAYDNYGFPDDEIKRPSKANSMDFPPSKANSVDIKDIYKLPRMQPDEFDEQDYEREPPSGFTEDGSFVGQYSERDNPSPPPTPTHKPRIIHFDMPRSPVSVQPPNASHESLV